MAILETLVQWVGALVTICIAFCLMGLVVEVAIGVVNAFSWCRWSMAVAKEHGNPLRWRKFPNTFFSIWLEMIGYRNTGNTTWRKDGGIWRGIGDWEVHPRPVAHGDKSV